MRVGFRDGVRDSVLSRRSKKIAAEVRERGSKTGWQEVPLQRSRLSI